MLTMAACTMMLLAISCRKKDKAADPVNDPPAGTPVTISAIQPLRAIPGDPVTITGTGFSATKANNKVKIGGKTAEVTEASHTRLKVIAPQHPDGGKVEITVNGTAGESVTPLTMEVPEAIFTPGAQTTGLPQSFRFVNTSLYSDNYEWFIDGTKVAESEQHEAWFYNAGVHELKLVAKRTIGGALHTDTVIHNIEVASDANLVAYYSLNSEPNDVLGHHHGTAVATAAGVSRKGVNGGAVKFNGISSIIRLPENMIHLLGEGMSISMWFKAETPVIANPVFGYQNEPVGGNRGASTFCPGVFISKTGKLYGKLGEAMNIPALINGGSVNGEWHHVCIAGDRMGQVLYLDGEVIGVHTDPPVSNGNLMMLNQIGAAWYGVQLPDAAIVNVWTYFKGEIDDVRIYKTVLNEARVDALAHE